MSLKLKMTLWFTLLMLVIVGLVLGFMSYTSNTSARLAAENLLDRVVEKNARELWYESGWVFRYGMKTYEDGVYIQVYDREGDFVMGALPPELEDGELPAEIGGGRDVGKAATPWGDFYYRDYFVKAAEWGGEFLATGRYTGAQQVSSSEEIGASGEPLASGEMGASGEMEPEGIWVRGILPAYSVTTVLPMFFVALPLLVVLAALGGWLMARNALAPVGKIAASAREISGGEDLSRRIDIGGGKDELHQLARTMNDMLDRLEKSFLAERQFTSDASHELRTPTAVILAECDMAQKAAASPEEFRESLAVIQRQGQKMSALLGTLLSYTRREQGTERPELERTDLSELTEAICREQNRISRRGISLTMDIEAAVTVRADASLIMSLIQNLITNAYKYGRENGRIWVSLKAEEDNAVLRVKDDGIGIPENCQELIWNRFYQVDPARSNQDGSLGLGLSMARQIAQLHGGSLQVQSVEGEGSEFTFTMPLDMKNA